MMRQGVLPATRRHATTTSSGGPKEAGWKNQSLDVETSVRYLFIFSNTKDDGPVVQDVPPAVAWAKFVGNHLGRL
jgi:hypothetical protein